MTHMNESPIGHQGQKMKGYPLVDRKKMSHETEVQAPLWQVPSLRAQQREHEKMVSASDIPGEDWVALRCVFNKQPAPEDELMHRFHRKTGHHSLLSLTEPSLRTLSVGDSPGGTVSFSLTGTRARPSRGVLGQQLQKLGHQMRVKVLFRRYL